MNEAGGGGRFSVYGMIYEPETIRGLAKGLRIVSAVVAVNSNTRNTVLAVWAGGCLVRAGQQEWRRVIRVATVAVRASGGGCDV